MPEDEFSTKKINKARLVAQEMKDTEEYYVLVLNSILDIFVPVVFANVDNIKQLNKEKDLTTDSLLIDFKNLQVTSSKNSKINGIHASLLGQLREMCKVLLTIRKLQNAFYKDVMESVETLHLGRTIKENLDFLEVYAYYWILFKNFQTRGGFNIYTKASKSTKKRLDKVVKNCIESNEEFRKKSRGKILLSNFFEIIWQRLPKYVLLLESYVKQIPAALPDARVAGEALNLLKLKMCELDRKIGKTDCISILSKIVNPLDYSKVDVNSGIALKHELQAQKSVYGSDSQYQYHYDHFGNRRTISPEERKKLIKHTKSLFDVKGYGYVESIDEANKIIEGESKGLESRKTKPKNS